MAEARYIAVVAAAFTAAWWAIAAWTPIIPSPLDSLSFAASHPHMLLSDIAVTIENTLAGFAAALALSLLAASAALASGHAMKLVEALNVAVQSISALVWAIVLLILFGVTSRIPPMGVAAATAFPILLSGIVKGFEVARGEYGDLRGIIGMNSVQELRYIILPASIPFIVASSRSALGSALRISVVAEALGGSGGVGYRMWNFYQVHEYPGFFAWAAVLVALMLALDKAVLERLEVWSRKWLG